MSISVRLAPNAPEGGDRLTLRFEGGKKPKQFLGKPCTIMVWELDKNTPHDLLATFEATIVQLSSGPPPQYGFRDIKRTDTNPSMLPPPDPKKVPLDRDGKPLTFPQFIRPYFTLEFPGSGFTSTILITEHEREEYIYELGIEIQVGGKNVKTPLRHATLLDCSNLLVHNCRQAALVLKESHEELVKRHGVGKFYGTRLVEDLYKWLDERTLKPMIAPQVEKTIATLQQHIKDYNLLNIDCYQYQLSVGLIGHEETLAQDDWARIVAMAGGEEKIKKSGQWLFLGLQKYGWKGIYFNMDTNNPKDRDYANDPRPDPNHTFKFHHKLTYERAKRERKYGIAGWELEVDDLITNYRPTTVYDDGERVPADKITKPTPPEREKLERLQKVPFGFIVARYGEHTTLLSYGKVYEVHWNGTPWQQNSEYLPEGYNKNQRLFRESDFATEWIYQSGMIMVPRRYWLWPEAKAKQDDPK
jgi:hypothetical protein